MATFKVKGGYKLKGDLHPQGAKNEALQVLCAVLLTPEEVIMENVPNIRDVNILIDLLRDLNVEVNQLDESTYSFKADNVDIDYTLTAFMKINDYLSTNFIVQCIYDDNAIKRIQLREVFGLAFVIDIMEIPNII